MTRPHNNVTDKSAKAGQVQNEAKRIILGTTKIQDYVIISSEKLKDTPTETMQKIAHDWQNLVLVQSLALGGKP